MNKFVLYCFSALLLISFTPGKTNDKITKYVPVVRLDSAAVSAKSIPGNSLDKYRKSKDFNYLEKAPQENGFWQWLLNKIFRSIGKIFNFSVSRYVFYAIFIGLFVLLLIVLFGADLQAIMAKSKSNKLNIPVITEENIENFDFDKAIKSEVDSGNYNRAVRYLYLKLLQVLTGNNLIVWQKEKTNRDYFRELLKTNYSADFRTISGVYEYVWYGKFPLERGNFDEIHRRFTNFFTKLNG